MGFAIVGDHGIAAHAIARADAAARAFFALPDGIKRPYHVPGGGGACGYTPFGTEITKDSDAIDLNEFWHVGREQPLDDHFADAISPNTWLAEVPDFRDAMIDLDAASMRRARGCSTRSPAICLAPDFFRDPVADGNRVLRLHYPPIDQTGPSIGAAPHEDIDVITLLLGADEAGLEILGRDGE